MALIGSVASIVHAPSSSPRLLLQSTRRCPVGLAGLRTEDQPERRVRSARRRVTVAVKAMATDPNATGSRVEEKLGVRIERAPSEARLQELGIRSWSKWGCPASKFPWTYDGKETCYLLQGKVKVYPEGASDFVEFGAGDLVVFPKGMSCTWHVSEAVDKHYEFEY